MPRRHLRMPEGSGAVPCAGLASVRRELGVPDGFSAEAHRRAETRQARLLGADVERRAARYVPA